ncbi:MAG: TonB-dependent receptor [Acidobacteria bacterium]|nr:TonB-dependent receptor [Acidobacteriota bacterium]
MCFRVRFLGLFAGVLLSSLPAWPQDARGSITGQVSDPQRALIPGATVVVTNVETNSASRTHTNATGYFEVNLLNPGLYTVTVESAGFKKSVRSGLELSVAGRLNVEVQLEVGGVAETVEVTAAAPLLDTTTASGGRVIDNRQIMQLPFSDLNPFALSALAPGMQWTGQPEYRRPFDNAGTSSFNTMGGIGQNEYTIDGAPVTGTGRRVGFVPPSDAVEEFKLETTTFDASYGHTSGATINVSTKGGTNTYHGTLYDQHWQQRWNATPHFTRLAFEDQVRRGTRSADSQKQAPGRSNNFGGTFGGPVRLPKIYDGKDKLFFFASYNGIYQKKAETTSSINRTVPKMAWREGDFSDLLAVDAVKYQIYDPRSARTQGDRIVRTPFPGNKGIPIFNPAYKAYVPFYPAPNNVPGLVSPEGNNNYYALAMPKDERFNSLVNRIDYNLSERHRVFGRWYWNHRLADEYDWTYETKRGLHTNGLTRINKGGGGNWVWTLSSSTVLDLGVSYTRFNEGSARPVQIGFKPSDVGLPKYLDDKAGDLHTLPTMTIEGVETVGQGYPSIDSRGTTGELKLQMSTLRGNHSLKYGWQERRYWFTSSGYGSTSGSFTFSNSYMRPADNTNTSSSLGLAWASFMMGLPSGISIATNDSALWSTRFRSLYVQDDWRVSRKLRLNLGLRYEREGGITERFNRGMSGGFLWDYRPLFADAVEAAYAKNPIPEMPASQFKLLGGTEFLGARSRTFTDGTHHWLPRAGLVYELNPKTILRGGYGWYYDTYNVNNDRPSQDGFSRSTGTTLTNDRALSFCCDVGAIAGLSAQKNPMLNPFPMRSDGTRFDAPYGNSLGAMMRQGRGWDFRPRDFSPARQQRWRIGVQREIRPNLMVEASYNGSYSNYWVSRNLSPLPEKYWNAGNSRNQALADDLAKPYPNPFNIANFPGLQQTNPLVYRFLSTQGFFTGSTRSKNSFLRAYPNLNGLTGALPGQSAGDNQGRTVYRDLQVQVERRFSRGFQTAVSYTWGNTRTRDSYLNEFDLNMYDRVDNDTRPHRLVWSSIVELPFGKGRRWVTDNPIQHAIGGWQLSWIYQIQSGSIVGWGNRFFYGDVNKLDSMFKHGEVNGKDIHVWFDPAISWQSNAAVPADFTGFEGRSAMQPASYQRRIFPTQFGLREDGIRNWDVKILRKFRVTERLATIFSVDALNATNHTNFQGPNTDPTSRNFGRITTQRGVSRQIQFNLRMEF